MPSESGERPDWSSRLDPGALPELMDGPCSYADFRECVRDIASATRLTRAYTPTLRFLEQVVAQRPGDLPLHVVDVGSGGGDVLRRVADWAQRRRLPVRLTGIDLNPHATRAAIEFSASEAEKSGAAAITWITGDVFTHPQIGEPDVVISSLVTHHMRDGEIVSFLRWMEAHAAAGWFISDLVRSSRSFYWFGLLARLMRWHRFVGHDGRVSIRRGFRRDDWNCLIAEAEIPGGAARVFECAVGRLCVQRLR